MPPSAPAPSRRMPVFLTRDEALRLIKAVDSYHERNRGDHRTFPWIEARDRAILLLLLGTGMRVSELVGLNLNSIQPDGDTARVIVLGKGGRERMLKLNNTAYQDPSGLPGATALGWHPPGTPGGPLPQSQSDPPQPEGSV